MRTLAFFALTLLILAVAADDALAFGNRLRRMQVTAGEVGPEPTPHATPWGYALTTRFPGYAGPHGYNLSLFPNLTLVPAPPAPPPTEDPLLSYLP